MMDQLTAERLAAREGMGTLDPIPIIDSATVAAKAMPSIADNYLTFNYGKRKVRYWITHRTFNGDRTEVTLYLALHRVINEGDPDGATVRVAIDSDATKDGYEAAFYGADRDVPERWPRVEARNVAGEWPDAIGGDE